MSKELDYGSYLKVDEIISLQDPVSNQTGEPAHVEMLYIITHQVYELWFKAILHELDSISDMFKNEYVGERSVGKTVTKLRRVGKIQKLGYIIEIYLKAPLISKSKN